MNWRTLLTVAVLAGLALGFTPALAQSTSGSAGFATVHIDHYYSLNALGYAVLNDSFTFSNNGTSSLQIPTLQVGLPTSVSAKVEGLVLAPSTQFTLSQSQVNGNTTLTLTPNQPTLNAGANVTVALKGIVPNVLKFESSGFNGTASMLMVFSPSVNMNVSGIVSHLVVPTNVQFNAARSGFSYSSNSSLVMSLKDVRPTASEGYLTVNSTARQGSLTPIAITHLTRTIVPAANGSPTVEEQFTIHNLSSFNMTQIHVNILQPGLTKVTEVPSTVTPLINQEALDLNAGEISFASANIGSLLFPNSNLTVTFEYPLPSSLMTVSGSSVTINVPLTPLIGAPVSNYSIVLQPTHGIVTSGQTSFRETVTPLSTGNVQFTYSISLGWAADQAIPAGILVFAVAFALIAIQRPESKKEEGEKGVRRTSDVLRAFEDKTGLEAQYMGEFASANKGSISRADFERMRNEVSELRSRAIQRLNEMKQVLGSGRQYDALTRVAEAEKEEDRAFRDLLNLYMQYHGNRMNEETFRRLQPSYKKRVDSAINHLSDTLHETQTEEK